MASYAALNDRVVVADKARLLKTAGEEQFNLKMLLNSY